MLQIPSWSAVHTKNLLGVNNYYGLWDTMEPHTYFMIQYTSEPFGIELLP